MYPHVLLRMKDKIVREFAAAGGMTEEEAARLCPEHEEAARELCRDMQESGLFGS